jgi:hypothetical protein
MFILSNGGGSSDCTQIMCDDPISTHSLAQNWEEQRPLMTFQKDIHLCGCDRKSEEIGIKWFLPYSSAEGSSLFNY